MTAPQAPHQNPAGHAVIEVRTSFFFLAFLLHFCKVYVALNGNAAPQKWGTVAIPVAPGRYTVEAWCNYFVAPEMGRNGVVVDAAPGTVTRIRWKAPWLIFLKGSVQVLGVEPLAPGAVPPAVAPAAPAAPAAAAPAGSPAASPAAAAQGGWHPDPSGRHEQRYHDGTRWTEHVSTAGVAGTDPTGTQT